ncbi:MAG: helix-turn-helix transcriptional regulator [Rhizobiaceae bacterium]|nr:helix-turn-helix transcriptional regulator [Rhizobiaceae bacterium]
MSDARAYGDNLGSRFGLSNVPTIISRSIKRDDLAMTEIRSDNPEVAPSRSIPREAAYLVALQVRDFPNHLYWEDGKQFPICHLAAGQTVLYDLRRDPVVLLDKPFHSIHFYLPDSVLDKVAEEASAPRISELVYKPGQGYDDNTMFNLVSAARAAFEKPDEVPQLFVDHISLAIASHVAATYGGLSPGRHVAKGGLAPWQQRRALELLASRLDGGLELETVARECGLSKRHFCRAFRQSIGQSPHEWLQLRRVECAKGHLLDRSKSLAEIGVLSGFSDQSHFTRVFTQQVGTTPGLWRKNRCD